jgi:YVTN family beta-propeller protein
VITGNIGVKGRYRCIETLIHEKRHHGRVLARSFCLTALAVALAVSSCLPKHVPTIASRDGRSEIQVYLQPLPPDSRRIQWTIGELWVQKTDGEKIPLDLHIREVRSRDLLGKQTYLASGFAPPGSYEGISFAITEAIVTREDGDAALLVPDDPVRIAQPFDLPQSGILPLFLNLDAAGIVTGGFKFSPSFSLALPSRELTSLTGYVVMSHADRLTVFNRKTLRVTGAVATGRNPRSMVVDTGRGRAYIAVSGDDTVEVLDLFQGNITERIRLRAGDGPGDLALSEDGRILVSANHDSDTLSILDPLQGVETERIKVGQSPNSVVINRKGTRAYVTSSHANNLSVVDLAAGTLSASLSLEEATPLAVDIDRDEENLFVISEDSPHLIVLDPSALTITDRIYVGTGAISLVIDDLSGLVLIGKKTMAEVAIVDPTVLMPVDRISLKGAAGHMVHDRQENALLVLVPDRNLLQKVDLVNKRVIAETGLDTVPGKVAVVEGW